jgi:hypothetical protein
VRPQLPAAAEPAGRPESTVGSCSKCQSSAAQARRGSPLTRRTSNPCSGLRARTRSVQQPGR